MAQPTRPTPWNYDTVAGEGVRNAATDAFGYNNSLGGAGDPAFVNSDSADDIQNYIRHLLLKVDWQLNDEWALTAITGGFNQWKRTLEDCDGGPRTLCSIRQWTDQEYLTQEFRLSWDTDHMRWTFGTFYLDQEYFNTWQLPVWTGTDTWDRLNATLVGLGLVADSGTNGAIQVTPNSIDTKSYAVYAHVSYDLSDTLGLSAGVRWNQEEKDIVFDEGTYLHDHPDTGRVTVDGQTFGFMALEDAGFDDLMNHHVDFTGERLGFTLDPTINYVGSYDDDFVNFKLQLDWQSTEELLTYASFRRGIKAGGFNNGLVDISASVLPIMQFEPEENNAFEVGVKWTAPSGLAQVNAAVYYYDYSDYQASAFLGDGTGGSSSIGTFVFNADATSRGAEIEATVAPINGLDVRLTLGYTNTEVENITNRGFDADGNASSVTRNRELGHAPELQFSALGRYQWFVEPLDGSLAAQLDYSWIDERFVDVLNDPGTTLASYGQANGALTYTADKGGWYLKTYIRNLSDKRGETQEFNLVGVAGAGQSNYTLPKRYGIELGMSW